MSAFDEPYYVGNLFRGEENLDYYPQVAMPPAEPGYGPQGYPQQPREYPAEVPNLQQQAYYQTPAPQQGYAAPQGYPQTYYQPQTPDYSWQQGGGYPYPQPAFQDPRSYMEPAVAKPAYEEYQGPRAENMPTETQMRGGHHDQQKKEKADDHHHSLTTGLQALMGAGKLFCTGVDVLAALSDLT